MSLQAGANFGPYRILGELGQGGMATVYRALQPSLRREVALKVIGAHLAADRSFRARFQREAEVLARLEHRNILTVYDYGEADGQAYIVYRYVAGGTLRDRLNGPLLLTETVRLLEPVAAALDYAHSRGVVHRDIKPTNILLTEESEPIVADFGLASILASATHDEAPLTETGVSIGTPAYMAPEQVEGRMVDGRTDQYALGIVAYQMLTGNVPFQAETPLAVALKQITEPMPLPSSRRPELAGSVENALLIALAKDPSSRYPSCSAFIAALAAAPGLASSYGGTFFAPPPRRVPAVSPVPPGPLPESPYGSPPTAPVPAAPVRGARNARTPLLLGGGIAAVLLVAVVVAVIASHRAGGNSNSNNEFSAEETDTATIPAEGGLLTGELTSTASATGDDLSAVVASAIATARSAGLAGATAPAAQQVMPAASAAGSVTRTNAGASSSVTRTAAATGTAVPGSATRVASATGSGNGKVDPVLQKALEDAALKGGDLPSGYGFPAEDRSLNGAGEVASYTATYTKIEFSNVSVQFIVLSVAGFTNAQAASADLKSFASQFAAAAGTGVTATPFDGGPKLGDESYSYKVNGQSSGTEVAGFTVVWRRGRLEAAVLQIATPAIKSIDDLAALARRQDDRLKGVSQ